MKITSKLALNQIKLNRKRTLGTILAISLSTALITAVMCFATSGNKMLTNFLGYRYGDYNNAYTLIIAVPALILGLLIAFMSIIVISNIFTASANKRIQEFGILKCVGSTKKQIHSIVVYESMWLSLIGIPLGLIFGTIIGYVGVKIASHFVDNINKLSQSIIMRPISFSLPFYISVWTYIFASIFSFCVIIRSASKPAKEVGKITAIQCIKGINTNNNLKRIDVKDKYIEKIFGYESSIGYKNITRNKAGYKATIRALSLGILLLLMTGGLAGQAKDFEEWMNPNSNEINVDYCSIRDYIVNEKTGREEEIIVAPISSDKYNDITNKLAKYDNNTVYGIGDDSCTYNAILDKDFLTEDMLKAPDIFDSNNETNISLISVDNELYKKLCERSNAVYGSNLLINSYHYNNNGYMDNITPFNENIEKITLINADEKETILNIGGLLYEKDLLEKGFYAIAPNPVRIIVPNIPARYFDWYCMPEDEQAYTEYARKVMDEYYPILTSDSYIEQGYTVRISRTDTMIKVLNIAIVLAEIVMYGFVILLIFMGFASVISTIATNIRIRSREFAVLKSIGMTNKSLMKMIYAESLICILKASVPGISFGIIIPFAINLSLRKAFPILYHIPFGTLLFGMIILIVVVMLITYIEINKLKKLNIINEIRMDVM